MTTPGLAGKVVVVPLGVEAGPLVRRLAEEGAGVVLVAREGDAAAGRLAADLEGVRTAVFTVANEDDADYDALVAMVGELFR